MTTAEPVEYPAAYPGVLSVGATDTQGGGFCSFSNRGEGLRLLAPGCDLDGAEPTTGAPNYNYWQGTSEASAIAAAALDALDSYQPGLSPEAAEKDLTEADNGVLDIAQTFRNAGLGAIVTAGEAAEPGAQSNSTPGSSPQPVTPLTAMKLTQPFGRPQARLKRVRHRLVLALTGRPSEAQVQVRFLGHSGTIAPTARAAHASRRLHEPDASDLRRRRGIRALHGPLRRGTSEPVGNAPPTGVGDHGWKGPARTMRRSCLTITVLLAVVAWLSPSQALGGGELSGQRLQLRAGSRQQLVDMGDERSRAASALRRARRLSISPRGRRREGRSGRRALDNRRARPLKWRYAGDERRVDVHGTGGHVDHRTHL